MVSLYTTSNIQEAGRLLQQWSASIQPPIFRRLRGCCSNGQPLYNLLYSGGWEAASAMVSVNVDLDNSNPEGRPQYHNIICIIKSKKNYLSSIQLKDLHKNANVLFCIILFFISFSAFVYSEFFCFYSFYKAVL